MKIKLIINNSKRRHGEEFQQVQHLLTFKIKHFNYFGLAYRGVVWKIILDYQPTNREQAEE